MKMEVVVQGEFADVLARLRKNMEQEGFAFVEKDRSFHVTESNGGFQRIHCGSEFWARKQLTDPHPADYAIVIEGDVSQGEGATIVRAELEEFHGLREHGFGGSHALEPYIDKFCEMCFG